MDGLALTTVTATSSSATTASTSFFPSVSVRVKSRIRSSSCRRGQLWFTRKSKLVVFAAKEEEPKLDQYDQMELKFGRMLGEDPKLTLAKVHLFSLSLSFLLEFDDGYSTELNFL